MFNNLMLEELFKLYLEDIIIFLSYIFIYAALYKSRLSQRATALAFGAAGLVLVGVQLALMLSGETILMVTLMPLTVYLPFTAVLFFLSDGGLFENAAICSVGMFEVLILKALQKILRAFLQVLYASPNELIGFTPYFVCTVIIALIAAGLVFAARRFSGAFRLCIAENRRQNNSLVFAPIISILLTLFYFLNSTADVPDIPVLIFIILTALSIYFIIAKLLNTYAKLINAQRSEREMSEYIDAQRRGYDRVVEKMEASREYRHDMRHHLAVIERLAKQGENDKIAEYAAELNGSFGKFETVTYCKNSELNALLSEYISRAGNAGCKVTYSFMLPETLPFKESDVCLVLANAIENAVNACAKLPDSERHINISAAYTNGHRLLISVENPCLGEVEFDENGLPVIGKLHGEEHGIGLRSVKRVTEKYNGFLNCSLENGRFAFWAALFFDNSGAHHDKVKKTVGGLKRAGIALFGLFLGMVVVLNISPTMADAASELLPIKICTIRWGDSSLYIQKPTFEGDGADELNSAVKHYTDEAKEKFRWYFNHRYNGYVGEDMHYTVIRDDEKYFIAQFQVTVNIGGSLDYSRWINYDKSAGKVLELADMFKEGSDYIGVLSAEILEQMKYKNKYEGGCFFIEGDDAFTSITPEANFYIDSFDRIVIVFDEYEVAPGIMGSPEFFIQKKIIENIAR